MAAASPGQAPRPADAIASRLLDRLPPRFAPYISLARLDRPIGWWLLLLPCWWSAALAAEMAGTHPHVSHLVLFFIGAITMRGAGSTWNDITDRDLDAKVARTRARPLPSGQIGLTSAGIFLVVQLLVGLGVLLALPRFAILVGLASLLPVIVYPFMKRITSHPQLVLGLAFAWGALMGFAVFGSLPIAAFVLYAGTILWVVGYDTIYALQDLEDDAIIGIGSTARFYGQNARRFVASCYGGTVLLIGAALVLADVGVIAFAGLAGFALHLLWQVARIDITDGARALRLFKSNRDAGLILFAGLALEATMRAIFAF